MGRTYYEHTLPEIARRLARMNELLQRLAEELERKEGRDGDA